MVKIIPFPPSVRLASSPRTEKEEDIEQALSDYQWRFGRDAYWSYLKRYGRRPSRDEAIGLGVLLGHQVKAADRKMYPLRSEFEKAVRRNERALRKKSEEQRAQVISIKGALTLLSEAKDQPSVVVSYARETDRVEIANHLDRVISWLVEFSQELRAHGQVGEKRASHPNSRCDLRIAGKGRDDL